MLAHGLTSAAKLGFRIHQFTACPARQEAPQSGHSTAPAGWSWPHLGMHGTGHRSEGKTWHSEAVAIVAMNGSRQFLLSLHLKRLSASRTESCFFRTQCSALGTCLLFDMGLILSWILRTLKHFPHGLVHRTNHPKSHTQSGSHDRAAGILCRPSSVLKVLS